MHATSQNILEAFNQLPEIEKHAIASEIIKQVALLDIPPLTDEALTVLSTFAVRWASIRQSSFAASPISVARWRSFSHSSIDCNRFSASSSVSVVRWSLFSCFSAFCKCFLAV